MRERIAIAVLILALGLSVSLSYLFAMRHNPVAGASVIPTTNAVAAFPPSAPADTPLPEAAIPAVPAPPAQSPPAQSPKPPAEAPPSEVIARGREVYGRNNCATCHSVAGEGNPRYPLDGTGSRWGPDDLRAWVTGSGVSADILSDAIRRRKERYAALPAQDLAALVAYLSTLKAPEVPGAAK